VTNQFSKFPAAVGSGFSRIVTGFGLTRTWPITAFAFAWSIVAHTAPAFTIDVASRSLRPGELVVLTMSIEGTPSSVRVNVFKKDILAFKLADGKWQALAGIDLDLRPGLYTAAVEADLGSTVLRESRPLVVSPRKFATRALRVDPGFVNPPPAEMTRITGDATFLRTVYASSATTRLWSAPFVRPVPGEANSRFGTRSIFNGQPRSPHGGTDFLSPAGTPIKSPNAGRIVCARDLFFTGNTVIVDHGLGLFSMLAHLSRIDVKEGEMVADGQVIGLVGATGRVTGPHLHWALTVSGARVDPLSALALLGT
jgi:murein DD-endopeptidase MepM/ murein hydrolase activator NlpD